MSLYALRLLSLIAAFATLASTAHADDTRWPRGAEVAGALHPSELLLKAGPLFHAGRQDEATFWFYAGQLRWRSRLAAHPDQDPTGEPALFSALLETIGPDVNGWAFGDIAQLQRTIDAVLSWDSRYPDPSLPPASHAGVREGLEELRNQIGREAHTIRFERTQAGLANR